MNINIVYHGEGSEESKKWQEKFVEACKEEGLDTNKLFGDNDIVISESIANKLDKVLERMNVKRGKKIVGRYGNKSMLPKPHYKAYKCRCGMCFTESKAVYYELVENDQVCAVCHEPPKPSTSMTRPLFIDNNGSQESPYSHTEPINTIYTNTFGKSEYYRHIHGYWRCSCGYTHVETLEEFMMFDEVYGVCSLCRTKLRIHSDTRNISNKKEKSKEEIEDLINSPFFAKGDEDITPIMSDDEEDE